MYPLSVHGLIIGVRGEKGPSSMPQGMREFIVA